MITHCVSSSAPPVCVCTSYLLTVGQRVTHKHHKHVAPWCRKPTFLSRTYMRLVTAVVASVGVVEGGCHDKKNARLCGRAWVGKQRSLGRGSLYLAEHAMKQIIISSFLAVAVFNRMFFSLLLMTKEGCSL